ncbi:MAG: hypothetical protein JNM17_07385 [Archangium sp.]|nr:hypothetical protein [Archangium sp.]
MLVTTLTLLVLADIAPIGPAKIKVRPPDECSRDTDCELSTFEGCCGTCCPGPPHAKRKGLDEARRCAAVDCAMPDCAAVRCMRAPDKSAYVAVCRVGQCVAVSKSEIPTAPPPGPVCRADNECRVVLSTPAPGQCCGTPMAQSIDAPIPLQRRPGPTQPKQDGDKPVFGLTPGNSSGTGSAQCGPCPQPAGMRARCTNTGQCVLAPNVPPAG